MRTIIDLSAEQLEALTELCEREGISRAEAVRRAVQAFTEAHRPASGMPAFGLWKGRRAGGLVYQRRLRREW
jgi:metal-responsive CopG/Arc/MetJ family transcriptional regulator